MIRLPSFPPLVWVVLVGTLLTRMAFFMVWPFLAIILRSCPGSPMRPRTRRVAASSLGSRFRWIPPGWISISCTAT